MEHTAIGHRRDASARLPLPLISHGDERLARLVARGNERAFSLLYERYHQPLYRYLRSLLGHDADAQDALQLTFVSALGALTAGRRDAPLRPWLFRIAHNHAISALRRRRPQGELTDTLVSRTPLPDEQAEERARLGQLVADLRELTDRQRSALVMRELSGLTHEDIAAALDMSVGAAKQTVFEARRALTEFAEGRAMACEEIQRVISDGDKRALRGRRVRGHLRSCPACAAFGASIETRRADLHALSPALPAAAAVALLARSVGAGFVRDGGGGVLAGGGGGGVAGGFTGKTVGVVVSGKAFTAGVAVLATAAVGATGVVDRMSASGGSTRSASHGSVRTARGLALSGRGSTRSATAWLDRRSGREAAGSLSSSGGAGVRQVSVAAGPPGSASPGAGRAVSATGQRSTSAPAGAPGAAHTGTTHSHSSSAPGRSVSQSARARGNSGTRPVTRGRSGSARAQAPGASGSGHSAPGSAGALHAASQPRGAAASTPSADRSPRAQPGTAKGVR